MQNFANMSPSDIRMEIRKKHIVKPTSGMSRGYAQANLVILKKDLAFDFLLFCQRNPKPCPLLDVTEPGSPIPRLIAPTGDIRTDIPKYRIYKKGKWVEEVEDITNYWEDDMVGFLIGCSFTFENALLKNGISIRHIEEDCNVPMYKTNIPCNKAGYFEGFTVVSMRPIPESEVVRAVQVTSRFPSVHGGPIHVGNPKSIGISDLNQPDFGDAVSIKENEVPVFWACGVTPQAVAMQVKPELMITHAPGHMFITDMVDEKLGVF
ncbi:putative hydro-lyase [Terrilactibacillus laevilacticus]|uniref:Putative hydro-lyase ACFSTF_01325 n=1 Tax=Terrilactibacillus laevilacticus TaxID=1380157 RepID=A0ABW5PLP8_9BACI|nr:putative hydro-lyase [Terrilactibacillus laevilacticus]